MTFNDGNIINHQMTIAHDIDNANFLETMEHNEFILIDLQCNNSLNILQNANEKLQNHYWILLNMNVIQVSIIEADYSNLY